MDGGNKKMHLSDARFIKLITVGGIDPNNPVSEEKQTAQIKSLNSYLTGYPRGYIIGKDIAIGRYMLGEHELCMQRTTYHVAFSRKPEGMD